MFMLTHELKLDTPRSTHNTLWIRQSAGGGIYTDSGGPGVRKGAREAGLPKDYLVAAFSIAAVNVLFSLSRLAALITRSSCSRIPELSELRLIISDSNIS